MLDAIALLLVLPAAELVYVFTMQALSIIPGVLCALDAIKLALGLGTKLALCTVTGQLHGAHGVGWCGARLAQGSASRALLLLRGVLRLRCLLR